MTHTDINNQCMNLNDGDNQKSLAAMHAGYQHRVQNSQHALQHE